jgi:hypothetical protein
VTGPAERRAPPDLTTEERNQTTPLRCCSCGTAGRISTICTDNALPVLRIAFDAKGPGKPGLLCPLCREQRP